MWARPVGVCARKGEDIDNPHAGAWTKRALGVGTQHFEQTDSAFDTSVDRRFGANLQHRNAVDVYP
jgi:hypothetical protein